jgi:hypothetical protein
VIEESKSPWSFALVAVPKKGGKTRWCVDYRKLNDITMKDSFPLPSIGDNLARLARSQIFTGIDGAGAFHVVAIDERDKEKTAFSTPFGLYQFKRMPFGLCNAPATYSRLVQMVLSGISMEMAIPYLDDTIVHSADFLGHLRALDKVLEAHRKAGLKLQPSKCSWFQSEVQYLGHMISGKGIRPVPEYLEAVRNWPVPTTKTEARAFLGKAGYYRRFIKDYSRIAAPWTDVIGKDADRETEKAPLQVTPLMTDGFQELKDALLSAPILAYPRFEEKSPFILETTGPSEECSPKYKKGKRE